MATEPGIRRIAWSKWLLLLLIVGVIGGGVAWWLTRPRPVDMTAVLTANARGIAFLDRFQYREATAAFEEVLNLYPDWAPGQINLSIALLNLGGSTKDKSKTERSIKLLENILHQDPRNPFANQCLGLIHRDQGRITEAESCFRKVTEADGDDPDAWCWLGSVLSQQVDKKEEAKECFKKAFALNSNNKMVLNSLQHILRSEGNVKEADEMLLRFKELENRKAFSNTDTIYSTAGRYAMPLGMDYGAIKGSKSGPLPYFEKPKSFKVELAKGARWANASDLGSGAEGDLLRAVRKRFGAPMVVLDFNGDGNLDLFLGGAVIETVSIRDKHGNETKKPVLRNLLLRNEGYVGDDLILKDVTHEMGLADHPATYSAYAVDYDNDGRPDLLLLGATGLQLFRHTRNSYEDVTKPAGLNNIPGIFLAAAWLDLDQDGDLDLLLSRLADTPADAIRALDGENLSPDGLIVLLNIGEAKPHPTDGPYPPWPDGKEAKVLVGKGFPHAGEFLGLSTKFKRSPEVETLLRTSRAPIGFIISDLDHDRDLDILTLTDNSPATALVNDRLLQFHQDTVPESLIPSARWNGGLVLDSRQRDRNDLFIISPDRPSLLLVNDSSPKEKFGAKLQKGITNAPALIQARVTDLDLDGLPDVVGLSADRKPVFVHNDGERLVLQPNVLGLDDQFPADGLAIAAIDLDRDFQPDVIFWSESAGLQWLRCHWNGNNGVQLELTGRRFDPKELRCNRDGIGTKVRVHAGSMSSGYEISTFTAGLGQSQQPLLVGIGRNKMADLVRVRWPDNVWQGEMSLPAWHRHRIHQTNRMPDSCPLLFTWDGEKYAFVCDFLGGGAIGEAMPDRSHRPPRSEESVKVESRQLKARDGKYILKLAEPMDEVTYLDKLQLVVVDHPPRVRVYPEERMASAAARQDLHGFLEGEEVHPISARDHKGRDVTKTLRHWDRNMVDGFAKRSWLGYAEDHFVQLDFGEQLAKYGPQDRLFLCLAGWTDYPYPEAMWAANQAGIALTPPVLERQNADGTWETIVADVGFPAGGSRMMMTEITGKVIGPKCVLRLKTNMRTYWDQIFIAPIQESATSQLVAKAPHPGKLFRTTTLAVHKAELTAGHVMQEYSPDGKQPNLYDFHKHQPAPLTRLAGKLTRFGNVTELLQADDDRFVIFGAGDELTVVFAADKLPELPKGWTRSFVLRTAGYCKGAAPFTATGETIEPLPFRAMSNFPYGGAERYPQTPLHQEYLRKYQTHRSAAIRIDPDDPRRDPRDSQSLIPRLEH